MAFTLKVVFEGVCAFVPSETLFRNARTTERIEQMSVMLPDLRLPELAYWDREAQAAPSAFWRAPHLAFLDLEWDVISSNTDAKIDLDWRDLATRRDRAAFFFNQRRLRVEGGTGDPLYVHQLRCSGKEPENEEEKQSLWWVPRMSEIAPPFEWFQGDTERADRGELPGVAGSIQIREGRLYVSDYNRRLDDRKIQHWSFGPVTRGTNGALVVPPTGHGAWNRAIGNRVVWELAIADSARFVFTDGAGNDRMLVVRPPAGADGAPIEVRIGNVEPEVGLLGSAPFFGALAEPLPDPDFQVYYRLSGSGLAPAEGESWVVPLAPSTAFGQNEKPCAPALFSGFSEDDE